MPQASDELRNSMIARFGDIDTDGPEKFLVNAGYELTNDWQWKKEGVIDLKQMSQEEFECLLFLVHEWDYGSLVK